MPQIIVDQNIPLIRGLLEPFADIIYLPYREITPGNVKNADGLIIRTRTKCNETLLAGSQVKFIATATIGIDHIDQQYCHENNIAWISAPGCNADSVKQYITAALLHLAEARHVDLRERTLGIVGVGNVGSNILEMAETVGMRVLLNDPPRARQGDTCGFIGLPTLLQEADIITVHVPLNMDGEDKTFHLFQEGLVDSLLPGTWFLNSSRGEVVDGAFIKQGLGRGRLDAVALDVWEGEPHIDLDLLHQTAIATPHIAGYSIDGKGNATEQCVRAACRFFHWDERLIQWNKLPEPAQKEIVIEGTGKVEQTILYEAIRATYNIMDDDASLRSNPENFEQLRGSYAIRREPHAFQLKCTNVPGAVLEKLHELGFNIQ